MGKFILKRKTHQENIKGNKKITVKPLSEFYNFIVNLTG